MAKCQNICFFLCWAPRVRLGQGDLCQRCAAPAERRWQKHLIRNTSKIWFKCPFLFGFYYPKLLFEASVVAGGQFVASRIQLLLKLRSRESFHPEKTCRMSWYSTRPNSRFSCCEATMLNIESTVVQNLYFHRLYN